MATEKVLFVERDYRPTHVTFLERAGFQVMQVKSVKEAIQALREQSFKAVIIEPTVPGGGGKELRRLYRKYSPLEGLLVIEMIKKGEFRETGNSQSLPIIVNTGAPYSDRDEKIKKLIGQQSEILVKMTSPEKLVNALKKSLT